MKSVIVVGGCGLLGKAIVESLKKSGNKVAVFDILSPDSSELKKMDLD